MYEAGELIIYGSLGVCKVVELTRPPFVPVPEGEREAKLHYVLEPQTQRGRIYVPVDAPVFMRPVLSREEAESLIDMIPACRAEVFHSSRLPELAKHYGEAMQSHRCEDLVALIKSVYAKKQERMRGGQKIGTVDEEYMRKAEKLLHGELAVALGMEAHEVEGYIAKRVQALEKGPHAQP